MSVDNLQDEQAPVIEFSPPRLGIGHLIVFTLCTAVLLAVRREIYVLTNPPASGIFAVMSLFYVLLRATAITSLWQFASFRRRGCRWRIDPGEIALIATGAIVLIEVVVLTTFALKTSGMNDWDKQTIGGYTMTGFHLLRSVTFASIAARVGFAPHWKSLFWLMSATSLLAAAAAFLNSTTDFSLLWAYNFNYFRAIFISGVSIVAVVRDNVKQVRRNWIHWLGVAVLLGYGVLAAASYVVSNFFSW